MGGAGIGLGTIFGNYLSGALRIVIVPDDPTAYSDSRRIGRNIDRARALWLLLILVGVLCRGPGWHWFWPWQPWDDQAVAVADTVNWPQLFGIAPGTAATVFGFLTLAAYYGLGVAYWFWRRRTEPLQRLGPARYTILVFLFLSMLGLPIKIALRLLFDVKYVLVSPWFNV